MIVIIASHHEAATIAREHGLTRSQWLPGATARSLRGLRGPIETIASAAWVAAHPKQAGDIADEIIRINDRYAKPEVTP